MMAEETLAITGITLYSIAIILHVIAINFLLHFRANFLCSHNQRICLLNMCFTELLLSIIGIIGKLLFVLGYRYAAEWVIIWQDGFLNVWYILIMVFLTFDRLLTVQFPSTLRSLLVNTKNKSISYYHMYYVDASEPDSTAYPW